MSGSKRSDGEAEALIGADEVERCRRADAYRRVALRELGRYWTHALVQPITAVHNYVGAATTTLEALERADDPVAELLEHIGDQIERAMACVKTLRSRLPELSLECTSIDLNAIARRAVHQSRAKLTGREVDLRWSLAPEPLYGKGDVTLLTQALINLIVNALEAMDATAREGRELLLASRIESDEIWISVVDTGPGVPEEIAQQVFEPLFSTKPAALGMGLPVTRAIAEAHDGQLRLDRLPQLGARFRFSLPRWERVV